MRRTLAFALSALVVIAVCPLAGQEADVEQLVPQLLGDEEAPQRSPGQLLEAYSLVISSLLPGMGDENIEARKDPQQTIQSICWYASRPGAEDERLAVCKAICKFLGPETANPAREWLLKQLERIGRDECLGPVSALLADEDGVIRDAARRALQNIPGPVAGSRLRVALEATMAGELRIALINTLGYRREMASVPDLKKQAADEDDDIRTAALFSLAVIGDKNSADLMESGMSKGSERARASAGGSYLRLADSLVQAGDMDAAADIYKKFLPTDGHTRCAALIGMGRVGGDEALALLLPALADDDPQAQGAARSALARFPAQKVIDAMTNGLATAGPDLKAALLGSLAESRDPEILPVMIESATDGDEQVRNAAYEAFGSMLRHMPKDAVAEAVNAKYGGASRQVQVALLPLYQLIGDETSLSAVRRAWQAGDAHIQTAALAVLAGWPDAGVADDLLGIARDSENPMYRVAAMKGYVAMLGRPGATGVPDRLAKYQAAMALARDPEGRKAILAGIGSVSDARALPVAQSYLTDEALHVDAGNALLGIASSIRWTGQVSDLVQALVESSSNESVRSRARSLIDGQKKYEDHIAAWVYCGPYTRKGKPMAELFDTTFPPERKGSADLAWRRALLSEDPRKTWAVDLQRMDRGNDRAGYLRTWVWAPSIMEARLEIGSDDGVKVWYNDELLIEHNEGRGIGPGQETADVALQQGWNSLLLKVTQGGGFWEAAARFRKPDGSFLPGLLYVGDPEFSDALLKELGAEKPDARLALIALDTVTAGDLEQADARRILEAAQRATQDEGLQTRAKELLENLK